MLNYLKQFDYFNIPIRLRFNGQDNHNTLLGLILTWMMIGLIIFLFYFFGKQMIEKQQPQLNTIERIDSNPEPI